MLKLCKIIGKSFAVAFSIYSRIPMPKFVWESDDMKYHLCFFPWIGAVIGALEAGWFLLGCRLGFGTLLYATVAMAIPLLLTGGFHLDGYMDTCDALHSYQDREKKLEIMKDPHIGAFSVISLSTYLLLALAAGTLIYEGFGALDQPQRLRTIGSVCMVFFLSRVLSGISVITMKGAKKDGMLQTFSSTAEKNTVLVILLLQLVACAVLTLWLNPYPGAAELEGAAITYLYYIRMSRKQFGGITGDLAGYFVCLTELVMLLAAGVSGWLLMR